MKKGNYQKHAAIWGLGEPDRSSEIRFYAALAEKYGRKVLSMMCATGEIAIGLGGTGFHVTAIDIEPAMIDIARKNSPDPANPVFLTGDVTGLDLPASDYQFAFIGSGDFHHMQTADERETLLVRTGNHLVEGGCLTLELFYPAGESWYSPRQVFDMGISPETGENVRKTGRTSYDADTMRLNISQEVRIEKDGETENFLHELDLQLIDRAILTSLFDRTGFVLVAEYGDFDGNPWQSGSGRWIVEAVRKPLSNYS